MTKTKKSEKAEIDELSKRVTQAERKAKRAEKHAETNPVVADRRRVEKQENKLLRDGRDVVPSGAPPAQKAKRKLKRRNGPLEFEADLIARPFEDQGVPSKVGFNPVPSPTVAPARTTYMRLNQTVAANTCVQYVTFPGHLAPPPAQVSTSGAPATAMDGVAYHSKTWINCSTGFLPVGPFNVYDPVTDTNKLSSVTFLAISPVGQCTNSASLHAPCHFDASLPYSTLNNDATTAAHVRWRLKSCGVKIINNTPGGGRGGSVVTVNFANGAGLVTTLGADATQQFHLNHNRSMRIHEIDDERQGLTMVWTPRLQDMAYWHSIAPTSPLQAGMAETKMTGAGFAFFINAPDINQTYSIDFVYNWMLSGQQFDSITKANTPEPGVQPAVEQVVTTLHNTASSGTMAPVVATAVPDNPLREFMGDRLAKGAYDGFHKLAHSAAMGAVDSMVKGFVSRLDMKRMGFQQ